MAARTIKHPDIKDQPGFAKAFLPDGRRAPALARLPQYSRHRLPGFGLPLFGAQSGLPLAHRHVVANRADHRRTTDTLLTL